MFLQYIIFKLEDTFLLYKFRGHKVIHPSRKYVILATEPRFRVSEIDTSVSVTKTRLDSQSDFQKGLLDFNINVSTLTIEHCLCPTI
jgi:hypothetical protein